MPQEVWGRLDPVRKGGALSVFPSESKNPAELSTSKKTTTNVCEVHILEHGFDVIYPYSCEEKTPLVVGGSMTPSRDQLYHRTGCG